MGIQEGRVIGAPRHDLRQDPGPLHALVGAFTLLEQGVVAWFWPMPNSLYTKRAQRQFRSYHRPGTIPSLGVQYGREQCCAIWF